MPDRKTPPPLPPDPFAEIKAQFGQENLETILGTYRKFADKVNCRKLLDWKITQGPEDLLQPLFLAALVVITKELDLGAVAADLQAAQSAETDRDALAESLAATARDLDAHIERRAQEIAGPRIAEAERDYHAKAAILRREHKQQAQRSGDLITELRRRLRALDRTQAELKELRDLRKRVVARLVVCATGPGGERYAPYDALIGALWPEKDKGNPQ